jgi:Outer membrane protein beta-barrel domain
MYPLSDKDLDRMSREAAEQNDVDVSPAGWERLEHKLNKELPAKKDKDRRRFLWIFFFAIALSGSGLVYLLNSKETNIISKSTTAEPSVIDNKIDKENKSTTTGSTKTVSPTTQESDNSTRKKENKVEIADQPNPAPPIASVVNDQLGADDNSSTKNISNDQNKSVDTKTKRLLSADQGNQTTATITKSNRKKKSSDYKTKQETVVYRGKESKRASIESKNKDTEATVVPEKETGSTTITNTDVSKSASNPPTTTDDTSEVTANKKQLVDTQTNTQKDGIDTVAQQTSVAKEIEKTKKSAPKTPVTNRFAFGLLAGTDISNINGELKTKAGYSFGIQASYNITKRFSVNTGFSITKKFYKAAGSDFHPPKHYFTYYVDKLVSVDGSCFMWELPVNLRYDLISTSKLKWYLNAGMSSYIMRKQDYRYDYIYNNTPASRDWSSSSQQNEWFKIVNLSSGIEYSLNKKWSMQAEPYFKLPTSGVGFGKMDISSYGLMIGLRYRPNFKR